MKTLRGVWIAFLLLGCGSAESPDGMYVVDVEASLEAARESVKYEQMSPDDRERSEAMLSLVAASMELNIDGDSFTWSQGGRQRSMRAASVEDHGSDWVYVFEREDEQVTMHVGWDNGRLALESSATDDMDYYRWKRIPR